MQTQPLVVAKVSQTEQASLGLLRAIGKEIDAISPLAVGRVYLSVSFSKGAENLLRLQGCSHVPDMDCYSQLNYLFGGSCFGLRVELSSFSSNLDIVNASSALEKKSRAIAFFSIASCLESGSELSTFFTGFFDIDAELAQLNAED